MLKVFRISHYWDIGYPPSHTVGYDIHPVTTVGYDIHLVTKWDMIST